MKRNDAKRAPRGGLRGNDPGRAGGRPVREDADKYEMWEQAADPGADMEPEPEETDLLTGEDKYPDRFRLRGAAYECDDLISIIVPCCDVDRYLPRCIRSILDQTYRNLEIILIDDGSHDRTGPICDHFAQMDSRIVVVHQDNGGRADARNEGLKRAHGAYIGFVDGDDYIEQQMYASLLSAIKEADTEIAICSYYQDIDNGKVSSAGEKSLKELSEAVLGTGNQTSGFRQFEAREPVYVNSEISPYTYIIPVHDVMTIFVEERDDLPIQNAVWNKLYRRDMFDGLTFPTGQLYYEDIVIQTKLLARCTYAAFVDNPLYHYIMRREGSIMTSGLREEIFTEQLPSYRDKDRFLISIDRRDLADTNDYMVYKKLLLMYTEARRDKTGKLRRFMESLTQELKRMDGDMERISASPAADPHQIMRMKMFLKSPFLFNRFTDINEGFVLPLRYRLRGKKRKK